MLDEYSKYSDNEIIARILDGQSELYEVIVRRYNPFLYKIGRSYNFSHDDTQDLMQDTYIDAYRNLSQFAELSRFKTWIIRIMMNKCYHLKEKLHHNRELHIEIDDDAEPIFSNTNQDTATLVQKSEIAKIIEEALSLIPLNYRIVFTLREVNDLSIEETAELLKISKSNVKVRLSRAKSMMREILENAYSSAELFEYHVQHSTHIVNKVIKKINELQ